MENRNEIEKIGLVKAVTVIKEAIQRSQARMLQSVNHEVLSLYYGVGRYVSEHSRHGVWGTGTIKAISDQLQKEIPGLTGFGESSIKNMRRFYEEWCSYVNRQPMAGDLPIDENLLLTEIRQPMVAEFDWSDFLKVPFTHHIEIIRHCNSLNERIFYIHQCAARAWSKYALKDFIKRDLYKDRGNLPSNFTEAISDYAKPMGVATFRIGEDAPEKYTRILPDLEGLKKIIEEE